MLGFAPGNQMLFENDQPVGQGSSTVLPQAPLVVRLGSDPALRSLNGTLERFPDLRIGLVELSSLWLPLYLMMLDGGAAFTRQINGFDAVPLPMQPSDYFRRQVRVSSFYYESPARIVEKIGVDLLMCCSDYPHSEGSATPISDYAANGLDAHAGAAPAFFADNMSFLLRRAA